MYLQGQHKCRGRHLSESRCRDTTSNLGLTNADNDSGTVKQINILFDEHAQAAVIATHVTCGRQGRNILVNCTSSEKSLEVGTASSQINSLRLQQEVIDIITSATKDD